MRKEKAALARHFARERADFRRLRSRLRDEHLVALYESGLPYHRVAKLAGVTTERARQIVRRAVRLRYFDDVSRGAAVRDIDAYHAETKARSRAARAPQTGRFKGETS